MVGARQACPSRGRLRQPQYSAALRLAESRESRESREKWGEESKGGKRSKEKQNTFTSLVSPCRPSRRVSPARDRPARRRRPARGWWSRRAARTPQWLRQERNTGAARQTKKDKGGTVGGASQRRTVEVAGVGDDLGELLESLEGGGHLSGGEAEGQAVSSGGGRTALRSVGLCRFPFSLPFSSRPRFWSRCSPPSFDVSVGGSKSRRRMKKRKREKRERRETCKASFFVFLSHPSLSLFV